MAYEYGAALTVECRLACGRAGDPGASLAVKAVGVGGELGAEPHLLCRLLPLRRHLAEEEEGARGRDGEKLREMRTRCGG